MTDSSTPFLATDLRPIDVLLYHGKSWCSKAIRFFDGTEVSHASLMVGADQVEEALFRGVVEDPLVKSAQGSTYVLARRLKDTPANDSAAKVLKAAHDCLGSRYAYYEILLLALLCIVRKPKWTRTFSWLLEGILSQAADVLGEMISLKQKPLICSEFVYRSYAQALPGALVIARASFFGPTGVPPVLRFNSLREWSRFDATARATGDPVGWPRKRHPREGRLFQEGEATSLFLPSSTATADTQLSADRTMVLAAAMARRILPDSFLGRFEVDAKATAIGDPPESVSTQLLAALLAAAVPSRIHPDSLLGRLGFDATAKAIGDPALTSVSADLEELFNIYIEECKAAIEPEAIAFPSAAVVAQLGRYGGLLHRALDPTAEPPTPDAATHHLIGLAADFVTPGDLLQSESLMPLGMISL
jgi:hypothetical protein